MVDPLKDSGTPAETRRAVRSTGRAARRSIAGTERAAAEATLLHHLRSLQGLLVSPIGLFVAHDGEPDLTPFALWLWDLGHTVALPRLDPDPDDYSMEFVPWEPNAPLQPGRFGIPVPAGNPDPCSLGTVLVSLTAFDARGNRLGRGGGFFDRFLETSTAAVIGVGFEAQRVPVVPTEEHDVSMPLMVTDLGVRMIQ